MVFSHWPTTIRRQPSASRAIGEPDYRALAQTFRRAERGQLGASAALSLQPHRIAAGSSRQPSQSAFAAAHFRHRRSRPGHLCAAGLRFQCVALFCASGSDYQPGHRRYRRGAAGIFRRQTGYSGPAVDRNLVFAAVSLHHHHREFDRRADLPSRAEISFCSRLFGC